MFQVKDVSRVNCKGVAAASLDEVKAKAAEKFGKNDMPNIHLDSDGTEIDDEDYFQTLEPNTELIAVFSGEQWTDVSLFVFFFVRQHFVPFWSDFTLSSAVASLEWVELFFNPVDSEFVCAIDSRRCFSFIQKFFVQWIWDDIKVIGLNLPIKSSQANLGNKSNWYLILGK